MSGWLNYHDAQDADQDAWVAALEKGRTDRPYLRGCRRICRIEVMRKNDRWKRALGSWSDGELHVARRGQTRYEVESETHLVPMRAFRGDVLHGEAYMEHLRAQARARRRKS